MQRMTLDRLVDLLLRLRRCADAHLFVLAIDLPEMRADFLRKLLVLCPENGGVIPNRSERFEPLAAIYPVSCLALAEKCSSSKEYSLQQLARHAIEAGLLVTREIASAEQPVFSISTRRRISPVSRLDEPGASNENCTLPR